jgi:hypothetical protein
MRFQDTLNETVSDFKRPVNLPQGTYIFQVSGPHSAQTRGENDRYEVIAFPCRPVEPTEDVDADALAEYGDITKTLTNKEFMLDTEGSERDVDVFKFGLKSFLEHCGVETEDKTLKQAMAEIVGAKFLCTVRWQQDKNDAENYFVRLGKTAPLE